ncbi:gap junction beta-1 protein [Alosa pseudoharengus]|uniref:gap junction beta-1 protein n=1 Tax=Alosa pseudoharengus TaxID=34774 RepID=UPI003F8C2BE8
MAAAIVTGLIPILRTAVDTTTTYKARTLWFGFVAVRLVVLFVTELPWFKLDTDFGCNATARDTLCTRACFNEHFDRPGVVAWNFLFILVLLSVLLMELFSAHLRASARKSARQKGPDGQAVEVQELMMLDLHASKTTVLFYLLSVALRIAVEASFVYVLLQWNLPTMEEGPFKCEVADCPTQMCVVRAAPEKRMSIFALVSISCLVIAASCLFFLYSVMHYLCNCGGGSKRASAL